MQSMLAHYWVWKPRLILTLPTWDNKVETVEIETVEIETVETSQDSQPQHRRRLLLSQNRKMLTASD